VNELPWLDESPPPPEVHDIARSTVKRFVKESGALQMEPLG